MSGLALTGALAGALLAAAPAGAVSPRVEVMVAGRSGVIAGPAKVVARPASVRVGGRRCTLAAGTPLAALSALGRPSYSLRDFGACSRRAIDSESLYVTRIGTDRASGARGWVYKVGRRALSLGAGSPRLRLRPGARVLWFYCRRGRGGCQRTLEVAASPPRVAPGAPVAFTVRAHDDRGRGVPVAGAHVRFAGTVLTTASDGRATAAAPVSAGRRRVSAEAPGLVPSFPVEVVVG